MKRSMRDGNFCAGCGSRFEDGEKRHYCSLALHHHMLCSECDKPVKEYIRANGNNVDIHEQFDYHLSLFGFD